MEILFVSAFRSELAGIRRRMAGVRRVHLPAPAADPDPAASAPSGIPTAPIRPAGWRAGAERSAGGADAFPVPPLAEGGPAGPYFAWIGALAGRRIAMIAGGMGSRAAFRAAFRWCLVADGTAPAEQRPDSPTLPPLQPSGASQPPHPERRGPSAIVSVGFCGGIKGNLRPGDVLIPRRIISPDGSWECWGRLTEAAIAVAEAVETPGRKRGFRIFSGPLYCSPAIVRTAAEKRALAGVSGADAVDMESAGVAAFCAGAGIPAAAVKVVLDGPGEELPKGLDDLTDPIGRIKPARLAARIALRPASIADMISLGRRAASCSESLGATVGLLLGAI
ncbi:MAG: hypothetical protein N3A38_02005 [Planctomycetota bacterium]|nr:hypothetical protein [Planctomycetota bacterium]